MAQMRPSKTELREMVRQCLLNDWDPIGIRDFPGAQNEYDAHVDGVCSLLLDGADAYKLCHYLTHIKTVNMGLSAPGTDVEGVVRVLLEMVRR